MSVRDIKTPPLPAPPLPASPGGRKRDGAKTRAAIEREALRLFAARGVAGASIREIAQAVGVADAALYRHFPSKEAMAQAIFDSHYAALAQAIAAMDAKATPFRKKITALVDALCALFDESPDVFSFLLLTQHDHLPAVSAAVERNAVEAIAALMSVAAERGEIGIKDANLAAAIALGLIAQPAAFALYGRLPGPLARHRHAIVAAILAALAARPDEGIAPG